MSRLFRLVLAIAVATTLHFTANSQSLSVNNTGAVANPSAILDVSSTAKGMLIPRMDKTQKNAIATPATGLLIYQTLPDSLGFHYYDGTQWIWLSGTSDSTAWKITGNSNITSQHFLGTTNDSALRFRVNNVPSGIVDSISSNTALGFRGLNSVSTGINNTAIGVSALRNNVTGSGNVAIGSQAFFYNRNDSNVAIGFRAGRINGFNAGYSPSEQTFVGTEAGQGAFVSNKNTAVGFKALMQRAPNGASTDYTNGGRNTAIGDSAMAFTIGISNVAVGAEALSRSDVNTFYNVAIGDSSMGGALSSSGNVAIGYKTLSKQQSQGYNTAVGYYSQRDSSVNTYYNTSIGAYSMEFNRTGIYNTGLGLSAMRNADSTSYNTAVGADAMYYHKKNGSNLAAGAFAMRGDSAGYWNTAVGSEAMDRFGLDGTARGTGFSNVAVGFRALQGAREAFENTAVGVGAMESDSSGNYNTAVGRYAGFKNKRGDYNVSMGYRASLNADTAISTVAIGSFALSFNKLDNNVGVGYAAGYQAGSVPGSNPNEFTFVGYEAGRGVWASHKNTALGFRALSNTDAGFGFYDYFPGRNTAIGDSAMAFSPGGSNVAIGAEALSNAGSSGTFNNVAIGDSAMGNSKASNNFENVAVGYKTLTQVKNQGNIAVGAYAGRKLGNTVWNTAIGYHALETDTTGSENTVVGTSSFRNSFNGVDNVGLGINTGYWATGNTNTYIGSYAGQGVSGRSTGSSNVGVGDFALVNARSAAQNVAVGENALGNDSTGNLNVAIGAGAMDQRLRGDENVGVGFWAGRLDSASINSVYVGSQAGYRNNRDNVVAIGYKALYSNSQGSTISQATDNVAVGSLALSANTLGSSNTAVGNSALLANTTGIQNTSLGYLSNVSATNLTNASAIGANALIAQNNSMVLGSINGVNSATATTSVGIGVNTPSARLHVRRNGASGGAFIANPSMIIEDNAQSYVQLSSPTAFENGILSGNTTLSIRSGLVFGADSSIFLRTGGNNNRITIDKNGLVGVGTTTPSAILNVSGNFALGVNGTVLTEVIKTTVPGNIPALAANGTGSFTLAVTNSAIGSTVFVSPVTTLTAGTTICYARVTAAGTVTVFAGNVTTGGLLAQAGINFNVTVIK